MIASIYGMNFDGIHELHWEFGYPYALGLMVLVSILTYLFSSGKIIVDTEGARGSSV